MPASSFSQSIVQAEFLSFQERVNQRSQQTMTGGFTYTEQFVFITCQTIPALVHVLSAGAYTDVLHTCTYEITCMYR